MACGTRTTLEQAIRAGWHQCLRCQFFIDSHCLSIVQSTMGNVCPSFSQGVSRHSIQPGDIPSEQLLIFVKDQYQKGRVGSLINSLFYTKPTLTTTELEKLKPKPKRGPPLTREEIWRRYGLVLVKRAQGKWMAWEKIGQT